MIERLHVMQNQKNFCIIDSNFTGRKHILLSLHLSNKDDASTPFSPLISLFCFSLGRSQCQFHLFKVSLKGFLRVIFGHPYFLLPGGFHLKPFLGILLCSILSTCLSHLCLLCYCLISVAILQHSILAYSSSFFFLSSFFFHIEAKYYNVCLDTSKKICKLNGKINICFQT